jgi:two-component system, NarL family, sensor kinase
LIKALEDEVQRIRQADMFSIDWKLTGNPIYLDAQKELIIFRIVQEAFNNIIKHAGARHAELSLHYNETGLYIAVKDDGNGFDPTLVGTQKQAGLKNMNTRIKMLQGTMNTSSVPGQGTTLSFTIPFE